LGFLKSAEEKKADKDRLEAEEQARRIANRSCPLLVFQNSNYVQDKFSRLDKFPCPGLDCLWWSQSGNECYILLACKKILGEV